MRTEDKEQSATPVFIFVFLIAIFTFGRKRVSEGRLYDRDLLFDIHRIGWDRMEGVGGFNVTCCLVLIIYQVVMLNVTVN